MDRKWIAADKKLNSPLSQLGHLLSISIMIRCAQSTAFTIAIMAAGTRLSGTNSQSFLAARIAAMIPSTRFRPSSIRQV